MGFACPTVYIVEDHTEVSDCLARLATSVGLRVQAFIRVQAFLDNYNPDAAGCLILDVRLPGINGMTLLQKRDELRVTLPIIMLSGYVDVETAVRAMKLGAEDFITKPFHDQELIECIQRAVDHDAKQREIRARRTQVRNRIERLTPRELEVMELVVAGERNKAVAANLHCSGKTVEVHRARVMEKMEAHSLPHLVRMAILAEGWTEPVANEQIEAGVLKSRSKADVMCVEPRSTNHENSNATDGKEAHTSAPLRSSISSPSSIREEQPKEANYLT